MMFNLSAVGLDAVYHSAVRLVLASASPRRAQLLSEAGYDFDVAPAEIDERRCEGEDPRRYVVRVAHAKAVAVAAAFPQRVVLGADTVVLIDDLVFGKPTNRAEAKRMLARLSGRSHDVLTGVVLMRDAHFLEGLELTHVTFTSLADSWIEWYVSTGEPADKAGAYAAQGIGSRFVERIDGSYTNVVGLPIALVARLLGQLESEDMENGAP